MAFGSFQGADRSQTMSEINMVPLIDIVLVLLVLFILAAPMAAQSVKISLPSTQAIPQQKRDAETLDIELRADGLATYPSGEVFRVANIPSSADHNTEAERVVRIWSDQSVRYEHLASLVVDLRKKGYRQISLMTRTK